MRSAREGIGARPRTGCYRGDFLPGGCELVGREVYAASGGGRFRPCHAARMRQNRPVSLRDRLRINATRAQRWLREKGAPLSGRASVVYHPSYLAFPKEAGREGLKWKTPALLEG